MAKFGEALAVLDDFRSNLISEQMNAPRPEAQAMAFRASAGVAGETPFRNVHATGVGVRVNTDKPGPDDFVIKVYMFDKADIQERTGGAIAEYRAPRGRDRRRVSPSAGRIRQGEEGQGGETRDRRQPRPAPGAAPACSRRSGDRSARR